MTADPANADPANSSPATGSPVSAGPVIVRPRRIIIYGAILASIVFVSMVVLGILLKRATDGVTFRTFDQIGVMSVGLAGAAAIMLVARPKLRADDDGILVRNILGDTFFPWSDVVRIAFPPGAHWARIVLAADDTHPALAIQALDRERAVHALAAVRSVHAENRTAAAAQSDEEIAQQRRRMQAEIAAAAARPLGRLEIIDRQKAAAGPRRRRRTRA